MLGTPKTRLFANKTKSLLGNNEYIQNFFTHLQQKYNLNTPDDWNSIKRKHIQANGGWLLLSQYSMFEIKCMACPEGKSTFNLPKQSPGYWDNQENVFNFLSKIKEKYNLNTPKDWNSIKRKHIQSNGGNTLLLKYSMFEIKCMACPEGKSTFNDPKQSPGYWENQENVFNFLSKLKEKYNLNTPEDWNSITTKHIQSNGGSRLLSKYSIFDLKCMACPEGKSTFNDPKQASGYWESKENILSFLSKIKEKYNLNTPEDWNSIETKHIQSNGGSTLLSKYSIFELKCMACPEGKPAFDNPPQSPGYWENQENIDNFLSQIKEKYNLNSPEDWNSITTNHIKSNGGSRLLSKYSIFDLKCMACPEGKSIFSNPPQAPGYWEIQENVDNFLSQIKEKYNLNTPEDWNSIAKKQIQDNGGSTLLSNYSMFDLKCMACPEGKSTFKHPKRSSGYWENQENIDNFLLEIKEKYNLNTPDDWNSITNKQIQSNGGSRLLSKYSMFELKCMACPEGKSKFKNQRQTSGYWENQENIDKFLLEIKEKYNLNTPEDWNSITHNQIQDNGGSRLLSKYSIFKLKCMACPEGKSTFKNPNQLSKYWENQENVDNFLLQIKKKYNVNTPDDWNLITSKHVQSNGGSLLLKKYSMFELKCMACPEGKSTFDNPPQAPGYWEIQENVDNFLLQIKEKYNLNTPEDWNLIKRKHIQSNGGSSLLSKYSMLELKCLACPEGKSIFDNSKQLPAGYWKSSENILNFLSKLKEKYNLNTPEDWNSITKKQIQDNGGSTLFSKYSMFELKCMACPEGKSIFNHPPQAPGYWEIQENILNFVSKIKEKYNLNTPDDWKRVSKTQIIQEGGHAILKSKLHVKVKFETPNKTTKFIPLSKLLVGSAQKRSSQRWLFLQVQKLFPHDEIIEDYFHPEISRISGANVQFDIFMIERNIAIEYHGIQHYEDIPSAFSSSETYKHRDVEKQKLCSEHGIQLIVIPYWWDNKIESLKETLFYKIKQK